MGIERGARLLLKIPLAAFLFCCLSGLPVPAAEALPEEEKCVVDLAVTVGGRVVVGCNQPGGLFVGEPRGRFRQCPDFPAEARIFSVSAAPDGGVWVPTSLGIFYSPDGGRAWRKQSDRIATLVHVPPQGSPLARFWSGGAALLDAGGRWKSLSGSAVPEFIQVAASTGDGRILAGTLGKGVWSSTDGGRTWIPPEGRAARLQVLSLLPAGHGVLAGTWRRGLFRSPDGVEGWQPVVGALEGLTVTDLVSGGSGVWAATRERGLFRSPDGIRDWRPVSSGTPEWNLTALAAGGGGRVWIGTWGTGLSVLEPDGKTFRTVGLSPPAVHRLSRSRHGILVAAAEGGRLYRSSDAAGPWRLFAPPAPLDGAVTCFAFARSGELLVGTGGGGIWQGPVSDTGAGEGWRRRGSIKKAKVTAVLEDAGGNLWAVADSKRLLRRRRGSSTWREVPFKWEDTLLSDVYFYRLRSGPDGGVLLETSKGLGRCPAGGPEPRLESSFPYGVLGFDLRADLKVVASRNGLFVKPKGWDNGGWSEVGGERSMWGPSFSGAWIDPGGRIWATRDHGLKILALRAPGDWRPVAEALPNHEIRDLLFDGKRVAAATDRGLWIGGRDGGAWRELDLPQ